MLVHCGSGAVLVPALAPAAVTVCQLIEYCVERSTTNTSQQAGWAIHHPTMATCTARSSRPSWRLARRDMLSAGGRGGAVFSASQPERHSYDFFWLWLFFRPWAGSRSAVPVVLRALLCSRSGNEIWHDFLPNHKNSAECPIKLHIGKGGNEIWHDIQPSTVRYPGYRARKAPTRKSPT